MHVLQAWKATRIAAVFKTDAKYIVPVTTGLFRFFVQHPSVESLLLKQYAFSVKGILLYEQRGLQYSRSTGTNHVSFMQRGV